MRRAHHLLARFLEADWTGDCAKDGVVISVSNRTCSQAKSTAVVSPGPTGTTRQPMRDNTKKVWPATNGRSAERREHAVVVVDGGRVVGARPDVGPGLHVEAVSASTLGVPEVPLV